MLDYVQFWRFSVQNSTKSHVLSFTYKNSNTRENKNNTNKDQLHYFSQNLFLNETQSLIIRRSRKKFYNSCTVKTFKQYHSAITQICRKIIFQIQILVINFADGQAKAVKTASTKTSLCQNKLCKLTFQIYENLQIETCFQCRKVLRYSHRLFIRIQSYEEN